MQVGETRIVLAIKGLRVVMKLDISNPNLSGYQCFDLGRSLFPLSHTIKTQFTHTHSGPSFKWVYLPRQIQSTINHSKGFLLCPAFYDTSSDDFALVLQHMSVPLCYPWTSHHGWFWVSENKYWTTLLMTWYLQNYLHTSSWESLLSSPALSLHRNTQMVGWMHEILGNSCSLF